MKDKHIDYLLNQFLRATGNENIDTNSEYFMTEFYAWIKDNFFIGADYVTLLSQMGVYEEGDQCIEVGKGRYDSIGMVTGCHLITSHDDRLNSLTEKSVIPFEMLVKDGIPHLAISEKNLMPISTEKLRTYITQNPYTARNISNWEQLPNSGNANIVIGAYGRIYDKNMNGKIKRIKKIADKIDNNYVTEKVYNGDSYFYVLKSNVKRRIKIKEQQKEKN